MSWRGDEYPVLSVDGTSYSYPFPVRDGRTETMEEEQSRIVQRINGERVHLERHFRWRFEYEWANLTEAQVQQLVTWRNAWPRATVRVRPHNDVSTLSADCWIEELEQFPGVAGVTNHRARATFVQIGWFTGSEIPDESAVAAIDIIPHS